MLFPLYFSLKIEPPSFKRFRENLKSAANEIKE
jgi:hypothetical protein